MRARPSQSRSAAAGEEARGVCENESGSVGEAPTAIVMFVPQPSAEAERRQSRACSLRSQVPTSGWSDSRARRASNNYRPLERLAHTARGGCFTLWRGIGALLDRFRATRRATSGTAASRLHRWRSIPTSLSTTPSALHCAGHRTDRLRAIPHPAGEAGPVVSQTRGQCALCICCASRHPVALSPVPAQVAPQHHVKDRRTS
ncbi:hypothetical protein PSPO01_06233 [Paraphaeosphaeria sporulosa]